MASRWQFDDERTSDVQTAGNEVGFISSAGAGGSVRRQFAPLRAPPLHPLLAAHLMNSTSVEPPAGSLEERNPTYARWSIDVSALGSPPPTSGR